MKCNAMQCNAMQCNAMQCNAMQCNAMQCNAMQCNAMQCNAMQCNAMQCNAMQCNAMQCNECYAMLHERREAQRSTAQHSEAQRARGTCTTHTTVHTLALSVVHSRAVSVSSCTRTVSTRHVVAASSPVCAYLLLSRCWVSTRSPSGFRWCGASAVLADVSLCGHV